jgi:hypothetical protein
MKTWNLQPFNILERMFDFQKHRNFRKSYRLIFRILIYGAITAALLFLIDYQQSRNQKLEQPLDEIQFEDTLYLIEEPLELDL